MATITRIVKVTKIDDNSLDHYDVNYAEKFVVMLSPEDLIDPADLGEVIAKANIKAAIIESFVLPTVSETLELPS